MKKIFILISFFIFNISNAQIVDFKNIDFTKADNIAKLNKGENLQNLPLLCYKLTAKLPTKIEKFRAIYTWVCTNISSDIKQYNKIVSKRKKLKNDSIALVKWNKEYKRKAFKKLLKHNKTMCTGYAYLIKELAFLVDIECKIIDGYGRTFNSNVDILETVNHSWNAVKLNNKWYLCDATWSSGYMDENYNFTNDYNDGYFLTNPILFAKNHYPLQKKWLLNNVTTKITFIESPLIYGEAFKYKIISLTPSKMNVEVQKNKEVVFNFKALKNIPIKKVSLIVFLGNTEKKFNIYNIKNEKGIITFKNKFKWKGFYDVHLKIGDDIVATYSIKVTKLET
jgi:transglutaminase/protease-like cytokinesis protein 3